MSNIGSGGANRLLYGVTISDTIKRGNQDEIQGLLTEARSTHQAQGDLGLAISQLEVALKRPGVDPRPLYGVPAHDVISRGDKAEIQGLLTQAKATHAAQGDLKQVIADLENALKK
jgi:uncharacterized protein DUF1843